MGGRPGPSRVGPPRGARAGGPVWYTGRMRCKSCDYPLWDLPARQCPECGSGFRPSDYEFMVNSVRFCCPGCRQAYYGTGPSGHLVPRSFACVSCGRAVDMDEMVLLPAEGVADGGTSAAVTPWAVPGTRNPFAAFFVTMGQAISNPNRTMDGVPPTSTVGRAAAYMAIHLIAQMLLSGVWLLGWGIAMGATTGAGAGAVGVVAVAAGMIVLTPVLVLGLGCVAHGVLRATGPTAFGLGRTLHAVCYSAGNNFLAAVPCLGFYLLWLPAGLWWLISCGFMLSRGQRVGGGRAALAMVVVGVLGIGVPVGSVVALAIFSMRTAMAAVSTQMNASRIAAIGSAIASAPAPVGHAAELVADGRVAWNLLFDTGGDLWSNGGTATTAVGGLPLMQFTGAGSPAENAAAAKAKADLPPGTYAYRVGDTVFTHPGIDPAAIPKGSPAGGLWLVVGVRETKPAATGAPGAGGRTAAYQIVAGLADGTTATFGSSALAAQLAAQNALRARFGLPPLADPTLLRDGAPEATPDGSPVRMTPPAPAPTDPAAPAPAGEEPAPEPELVPEGDGPP